MAKSPMRCQLQLSPDCRAAEVRMYCPPGIQNALACIPCGKAFQVKLPHALSGLSLRPIEEEPQ